MIVKENPLQNLKVLYGTGAIKLNESNEPVRVGGVRWVIKDGLLFDAKKLLSDVADIVDKAKKDEGWELTQPGASRE